MNYDGTKNIHVWSLVAVAVDNCLKEQRLAVTPPCAKPFWRTSKLTGEPMHRAMLSRGPSVDGTALPPPGEQIWCTYTRLVGSDISQLVAVGTEAKMTGCLGLVNRLTSEHKASSRKSSWWNGAASALYTHVKIITLKPTKTHITVVDRCPAVLATGTALIAGCIV